MWRRIIMLEGPLQKRLKESGFQGKRVNIVTHSSSINISIMLQKWETLPLIQYEKQSFTLKTSHFNG